MCVRTVIVCPCVLTQTCLRGERCLCMRVCPLLNIYLKLYETRAVDLKNLEAACGKGRHWMGFDERLAGAGLVARARGGRRTLAVSSVAGSPPLEDARARRQNRPEYTAECTAECTA